MGASKEFEAEEDAAEGVPRDDRGDEGPETENLGGSIAGGGMSFASGSRTLIDGDGSMFTELLLLLFPPDRCILFSAGNAAGESSSSSSSAVSIVGTAGGLATGAGAASHAPGMLASSSSSFLAGRDRSRPPNPHPDSMTVPDYRRGYDVEDFAKETKGCARRCSNRDSDAITFGVAPTGCQKESDPSQQMSTKQLEQVRCVYFSRRRFDSSPTHERNL